VVAVSEATYEDAKGTDIEFKYRGEHSVKGKAKPVKIYEAVC
jgi:class 3 adenylate cyclase